MSLPSVDCARVPRLFLPLETSCEDRLEALGSAMEWVSGPEDSANFLAERLSGIQSRYLFLEEVLRLEAPLRFGPLLDRLQRRAPRGMQPALAKQVQLGDLALYARFFQLLTSKTPLFRVFVSPEFPPLTRTAVVDLMYKAVRVLERVPDPSGPSLDAMARAICLNPVMRRYVARKRSAAIVDERSARWRRLCSQPEPASKFFDLFMEIPAAEFYEVLKFNQKELQSRLNVHVMTKLGGLFPTSDVPASEVLLAEIRPIPAEIHPRQKGLCLRLRLLWACEGVRREFAELRESLGGEEALNEAVERMRMQREAVSGAISMQRMQPVFEAWLNADVGFDLEYWVPDSDLFQELDPTGNSLNPMHILIYIKVFEGVRKNSSTLPQLAEWPAFVRFLTAPTPQAKLKELLVMANRRGLNSFLTAVEELRREADPGAIGPFNYREADIDVVLVAVNTAPELLNPRTAARFVLAGLTVEELREATSFPAFVNSRTSEVESLETECILCCETYGDRGGLVVRLCQGEFGTHELCQICTFNLFESSRKNSLLCPICRRIVFIA